ncbi:MAG: protein translocase subunit SecD [Gammaproteobacteria bacterium]|nr:protein translocase subunit SecD [Gammaproteobacteria bacterium]
MNRFPVWKNAIVILALLAAVLVSLPNLFGDEPAVQVSLANGQPLEDSGVDRVTQTLDKGELTGTALYKEKGRVMVRFPSVDVQLKAADLLRTELGKGYIVALTLTPSTPSWLRTLGLKPVPLGLDLRGGVHFLFEVDMSAAIKQRLDAYSTDFTKLLRDNRIRRSVSIVGRELHIRLPDAADADRAEALLRDADPDLEFDSRNVAEGALIVARMTPELIKARQDFAIQQNTTTLRNRVNELGVAEPIVQRQGLDRIVVQLPGVQDPAQAERVLGATATLEFRLVCDDQNAFEAERTGRVPLGCELNKARDGSPVLVRRRTIVTGDQLVDASQGFSEGQPAVFVRLDSKGARNMLDTTKANLKKPMAVVFVEQKRETIERDGQKIEVPRESREVINVATINGVFSSNFQITGLDTVEARDLSLLLRAGALAAPIYKVEERTIGPSLGQDNIDRGIRAFLIGFAIVAIFMMFYYKVFGFIANLGLLANVLLIMALLSMIQAALTLPGIAGIVLTMGMAVDANVLICERIREELRNGMSPQAAIHAGYDKAFSTIADANITTLIAGIVLFAFGTGPVKGFAVVLCIGILTSLFTALTVTRAFVNFLYGSRKVERLSV